MAKLTDFEALQIAAVYFQGEKTPHVANTSDQRIEMLFDLAEKIQAEYEKRKAEDSERFLSEENLTSANPFMWGASNIANFGANVAGTVVNTFENISAAGAAAQRESLNSAIPEDIRDIEERRRLAQFPGATRYKLHKLDERFNAGLDSAELAEANEERAQLLKE